MSREAEHEAYVAERQAADALEVLEQAQTLIRIGLSYSFQRPVTEANRGQLESALTLALHLSNDMHDALTVAAGGEAEKWPEPDADNDDPIPF